MGMPVVTVAAGGLPIVESTNGFGTPVTEAASGRGVAVTKVIAPKPGLPVIFETIGIAPAFATFDAAPSTAFITMSNGNLTVTKNTSTNSGTARSTAAKASGKYYFEMTNTVKPTGSGDSLGLALTTTNDANVQLGVTTVTVEPAGATFIFSNDINQSIDLGAGAAGNVYGFAIDLTNRLAWIRRSGGNWNGNVAANPATGANGVVIGAGSFAPVVYLSNTVSGFCSVTANFGASAFIGAVPSGFTAGWPP
jgi:hypothetical protein